MLTVTVDLEGSGNTSTRSPLASLYSVIPSTEVTFSMPRGRACPKLVTAQRAIPVSAVKRMPSFIWVPFDAEIISFRANGRNSAKLSSRGCVLRRTAASRPAMRGAILRHQHPRGVESLAHEAVGDHAHSGFADQLGYAAFHLAAPEGRH